MLQAESLIAPIRELSNATTGTDIQTLKAACAFAVAAGVSPFLVDQRHRTLAVTRDLQEAVAEGAAALLSHYDASAAEVCAAFKVCH